MAEISAEHQDRVYGIEIDDLRPSMCRFPLWGREQKSGFYCGAKRQERSSYCGEHTRICSVAARSPISIPASLAGDRRKVAA